MNKRAKGMRIEREIANFLERQGYSVYRPSWNRWGSKDIFNNFDILAFKKEKADEDMIIGLWLYQGFINDHPLVWLLQVKSQPSHFYKARKQIKEWYFSHDIPADIAVGVILRKEKKYYRVWIMWNEKEHDWEVDWRDFR